MNINKCALLNPQIIDVNFLISKSIGLNLKFRDWSLITGRGGGATKREGGHVKFYPYEKGGQKNFKPC